MPAQKPASRFNPLGSGGPRPARPRPGWSLWYGLGLLLLLGVVQMYFMTPAGRTLSYSEFKTLVRSGEVSEVTIGEQSLRGTLKAGNADKPQLFTVNRVEDPKLAEDLEAKGVKFTGEAMNRWVTDLLGWVIPVLFIMGLWGSSSAGWVALRAASCPCPQPRQDLRRR
jgi:cell division protease FtsH